MRSSPIRSLMLLIVLLSWSAPAAAARDPYRTLFTVPPIAADAEAPSRLRFQDPRQQKHEPPEHTGFAALVYSTGSDFNYFPRRASTWVILGAGGAAALLAHPIDDTFNDHLAGSRGVSRFFSAGQHIGAFYVQLGAATGMYLVGRYVLPPAKDEKTRTNKVSHLGFDLVRALVVSQALTQGVKNVVRRERPNGDCCAFPSGHSSAAFATASVLERHLGYRGAWPTILIASYVAASRMHDNVHYLSDVLFGAALGVASGWTVVGRHGRSQYALMPVPVRGGVMVSLVGQRQGFER